MNIKLALMPRGGRLLGAEAGHRQSLRTVCRLPKAIGLRPMAARRCAHRITISNVTARVTKL